MTSKKFFKPRSQAGFTIIEMIVVFSVIAILSSIGVTASVNYSRAQSLETARQDLVTVLNQAKSYAQSQYKPPECANQLLEKYKVEVNVDPEHRQYVLYAICESDQEISRASLPNDVTFGTSAKTSSFFEYPILKGGIEGDPDIIPPWEIILVGADNKTKTITINKSGGVE